MFPSHYDPLKEMNRSAMPGHVGQYAPGPYSIYAITSDKLPRACVFLLSRTEQLPPSKDAAWFSNVNNANRKDKIFWKSVLLGLLKNLKKKKDNKLNLEQSICNNITVLWKFLHIMKEEP